MASTPKPNPAVEFVEVFKAELAAISFRRRKLVASQGGNSSAVFISRRKDAEIVPSSVGGDTIKVTKDSRLSGLALFHPAGHFGEATTIRSAGGFGTGI